MCDGSQCNAVDPSQLCGVHAAGCATDSVRTEGCATASVRSISALHCIHRDRVGEGEGEGEGVFVFRPLSLHLSPRPLW